MLRGLIVVAALFWPAMNSADAESPAKASPKSSPLLNRTPPDLSSMSAGNAAGVLGYCVKNKHLSHSKADAILYGLLKKPGVRTSKEYVAGEAGKIVPGRSSPLLIGDLPNYAKPRACEFVLKQGALLL